MTPHQYYQLRKHHALLEEAKQLMKYNPRNKAVDMIKFIAFKQKAGMMPAEYIERYDNCWKD